jgi:transposase
MKACICQAKSVNYWVKKSCCCAHSSDGWVPLCPKGVSFVNSKQEPDFPPKYHADRRPRNTLSAWLRRWQTMGLAGLAEGLRSGLPAKRPPVVKKVVGWFNAATQHLREWLPAIRRAWGIRLPMSTLHRIARRQAYPLKRCQRSLRAQRDASLFASAQAHLRALHQAEACGEVAVIYGDIAWFITNLLAAHLTREMVIEAVQGRWQVGNFTAASNR